MTQSDLIARLARQSLRRPLTPEEDNLAEALREVFATGQHDFEAVARALQERGVPRPSGETGAWTLAALEVELVRLNASLDAAYAANDLM